MVKLDAEKKFINMLKEFFATEICIE